MTSSLALLPFPLAVTLFGKRCGGQGSVSQPESAASLYI
jgi:hypothetical protein